MAKITITIETNENNASAYTVLADLLEGEQARGLAPEFIVVMGCVFMIASYAALTKSEANCMEKISNILIDEAQGKSLEGALKKDVDR